MNFSSSFFFIFFLQNRERREEKKEKRMETRIKFVHTREHTNSITLQELS